MDSVLSATRFRGSTDWV